MANPRELPSIAAISIASTIIGCLGGYFLTQAWSLGLLRSSGRQIYDHKASVHSSSGDEDDNYISELKEFPSNASEECKLILVVRTDLGMSVGKIAAQCSHATLACYKTFLKLAPTSPVLRRWEKQGQTKITLQVKSEEELRILQAQAVSLGLVAEIIHDAGRTEIASGTATVLGVGPGPKTVVDQVTGQLRLLR